MKTALDLFCGGGGASMGIKQAGFDVQGVDITPQGNYPFNITITDALNLPVEALRKYDFIWASPPCQAYTRQTIALRRNGKEYPDLINQTRQLLLATGKPFVIENVPGAPIRKDLVLCGEMFGLRVIRHRAFEVHGFKTPRPVHIKHRARSTSNNNPTGYYYTITGHNTCNGSIRNWQKAIGINWLGDKATLAQAIPPAYSEYIAWHLINSNQ